VRCRADGRTAAAQTPIQKSARQPKCEGEYLMIYAFAAILFSLWLLGTATSHVAGGYIDLLLIVAVVTIMLNLIGQRRTI
jgi:Family of unknown function (DUF5670)